jgi:hypothetical protein
MKTRTLTFTLSLLLALPQTSSALDAACEPILAASEARMKMPAWHSASEVNGGNFKLEAIKADGKFYIRTGKGKWSLSPINIDETEQKMLAQIASGEIKLAQCKDEGSETVEGTATRVISYRVEIKGGPAADTKLYIGKADGLPYAATSDKAKSRYSYTGVVAPKL